MKETPIKALLALTIFLYCEGFSQAQASQWSSTCSNNSCKLLAQVVLEDGSVYSQFIFQRIDGRLYGLITTPLEIDLRDGVVIGIDNTARIETEMLDCKSQGCRAIFDANDKVVQYFIKGLDLAVVFRERPNGDLLGLSYSLVGFTEAYKEFLLKSPTEN